MMVMYQNGRDSIKLGRVHREHWQCHLARCSAPGARHLVLNRLDVGANSDLNLNSARDQIIYDEKWLIFEENLYRVICKGLRDILSSSDLKILDEIIQKNNTDTFSKVAKEILSK